MNLNCITGNQDHLYKHIQQSIHNAKSIDIIVSFLMESGVKLIQEDLKYLKSRNIPIRILTGNYLNITQPSALYLIKDILGDSLDLRFYSDTNRSFHAKAYIFEYDKDAEIFIGSSNLSRSAWTSAIEWNYRIGKEQNPEDFNYFKNMFEDLFNNESIIVNDQELEKYSKTWKRPKLNLNLENKKEEINYTYDDPKMINLFEPRGAQIEALYELKKTREEGNDKGLVVAATGIGKTYLAAFDSKNYNRVLFVAHREEILRQAYDSFKNIRKDKIIKNNSYENEYMDKVADTSVKYLDNNIENNTEEKYNMGFFMNSIKDTDKDIVFASVQSLGKKEYLNEEYFPKDYFDYVVVDEFHHAVSNNYQNIINYFEPKFMLGITATPDRLDNKDVFSICDYNTVYEVTLKNAIDKGWLVPFRYYGIYDNSIDYDNIEFKNGKYNEKELELALSINNRAELIINHYKKYKSKRALGFCTSKAHAEFMAKYFSENGIKACAVYSGSEGEYNEERGTALKKLRDEEIQVIFSVDMFNEGLDVKSIDMVMFLRPTESPTVFLQQLGRGLRKDKSKKYLNVLDFIGNYKKANLIPLFLSGNTSAKEGVGKSDPLCEENYPEDCIVDFDFRLVDIFERMNKAKMKLQELIDEEYFRIKEYLGHRPSRTELITYMDNNIYANMRSKNNILDDYFGYLETINELSEEEKELKNSKAYEFLNMIAVTKMNKFYKIPILLTIYNKGNIKIKISNDDCDAIFSEFCRSGSNKYQIIKGEKLSGLDELDEKLKDKKFISNARRQPINAFLKSNSEFFYLKDGELCLDDSLIEYLNDEIFKREFKDCIDYRLKRFYKEKHNEE